MRQPHAIINFHDLESDILDTGVFKGCWENIDEAKKFANKLLSYVRRYEPVPRVCIHVIEPEFPPEYQIAKMKSKSYSDKQIIEKAKTWGFEETKVREIINDHI